MQKKSMKTLIKLPLTPILVTERGMYVLVDWHQLSDDHQSKSSRSLDKRKNSSLSLMTIESDRKLFNSGGMLPGYPNKIRIIGIHF